MNPRAPRELSAPAAVRGMAARTQETARRAIARRPGGPGASAAADLRRVFPDLPRTPARRDVEGRADRLLRRAAAAEMAREGVELVERLVDLPDPFTRGDLTAAQVPSLPSYEAFVVAAAAAPRIRPLDIGAADARAALRAPGARDASGITLEAAGDAVSYLLTRAWDLLGPAGTGCADRETYLEQQRDRARRTVRTALTDAVTVPQELRVARERRAAVLVGGRAAEGELPPESDGADGIPGASDPPAGFGEDEDLFGDPSAADPLTGQTSEGASEGASEGGRSEGGDAPRRRLADRARSVQDFLQSDVGRGASDFLRSDAGKAAMAFMAEHGKDAAATARDLYLAAQKRSGGGGSSRSSGGGGASRG